MIKSTQKGITLIALIITIIVMLILVGVTINFSLNGGIIEKARTASFETEIAQIKEQITLAKAVKIIDNDNTELTWSDLDIPQDLKSKYQGKLVISGDKLYYNSEVVISAQEQSKYESIGITEYVETPTEQQGSIDPIVGRYENEWEVLTFNQGGTGVIANKGDSTKVFDIIWQNSGDNVNYTFSYGQGPDDITDCRINGGNLEVSDGKDGWDIFVKQ